MAAIDTNNMIPLSKFLDQLDRSLSTSVALIPAVREHYVKALAAIGLDPSDMLLASEEVGTGSSHRREVLYVRANGVVMTLDAYIDTRDAAATSDRDARSGLTDMHTPSTPKLDEMRKRLEGDAAVSFAEASKSKT